MINETLTLPCGAEIPNRLCKAAMTEGLADPSGAATEALAATDRDPNIVVMTIDDVVSADLSIH